MSALVKYEAARQAIAECKSFDEVKEWSDKAAAMQAYGRMAKDKTLEVDAAEIRIRAERRLGELIAAQKAEGGLNKGGRPAEITGRDERPVIETPTLADAGISKDLSSRAQKLAAVPAEEFEQEVGEWRERVTEETARVSARLVAAGEKAQGNKREESKYVGPNGPAIPEGYTLIETEQLETLRQMLAETVADNESMARVWESDDKVKAALAEAARFREQARIASERVNGMVNECNEAKRAAKRWKAAFDKLDKKAA